MPHFIDENIPSDKINVNERAVIEKYEFEVRGMKGGVFEVTDPVLRIGIPVSSSIGRRAGSTLESLLKKAVAERLAFNKKNVKPVPQLSKKAAAKAKAAEHAETAKAADAVNLQEEAGSLSEGASADASALIMSPPKPAEPAPAEEKAPEATAAPEPEQAPETAQEPAAKSGKLPGLKGGKGSPDVSGPGEGQTVGEAVANSPKEEPENIQSETGGDTPAEITASNLDETGKRETAKSKREKGGAAGGIKLPRESRYQRSARIILSTPGITAEQLAKQTNLSPATAGYCLAAFEACIEVLAKAGYKVPDLKAPVAAKGATAS